VGNIKRKTKRKKKAKAKKKKVESPTISGSASSTLTVDEQNKITLFFICLRQKNLESLLVRGRKSSKSIGKKH
jgi:hypothetical protein